jgi:dTDP-4-amino-4,6-dideoxygalactose transaminase
MFGEELPGQGRDYNARMMGWNYRIDVLAAAFARSQLHRLADNSRVRSANGERLAKQLRDIPGLRAPTMPDGSTHVYFFFPILVGPEDLGLTDVPAAAFRSAVDKAMNAEGVAMMRWQPQPVPMQVLFQEMLGYGNGCPWSCGPARPGIRYDPGDFPVAADICERRLVMGQTFSSFGPPNDEETMDRYAEAFRKVFVDGRDALIALARQERGSC